MQKFIKLALIKIILISSFSYGYESEILVQSFEVVKTKPENVFISLSGIDKTKSAICISAVAKSQDGNIRSRTETTLGVDYTQGKNTGYFNSKIVVFSPSRTEPVKTEVLSLTFTVCDNPQKNIITTINIDWHHDWKPELIKPYEVVRAKILSEEFETLDHLLQKWILQKERDENGAWKLSSLKTALGSTCYREKSTDWKKCFTRIQSWKKASPTTAGLAEAKYWIDYAWNVRGGRYTASNNPLAIEVFLERMQKAEQSLLNADSIKHINPMWYELYLDIVVDSKKDKKMLKKVFKDAVKSHPTYLPLYSSMSNYLVTSPDKEPDWSSLDSLINLATDYTREDDGDSSYGRLYSELIYTLRYSKNIFDSTYAEWPRLRESFKIITTDYPSAQNLNLYAILACQADDSSTFLTLWPKLEKQLMPKLWPHNYSIDLCKHKLMEPI